MALRKGLWAESFWSSCDHIPTIWWCHKVLCNVKDVLWKIPNRCGHTQASPPRKLIQEKFKVQSLKFKPSKAKNYIWYCLCDECWQEAPTLLENWHLPDPKSLVTYLTNAANFQFLRCFVGAGKWQQITDIGGRPAPVLSCHTSSPPNLTSFSSVWNFHRIWW